MTQDSNNPFAIPGMNAAFMSSPNNPLLTSMDMMRQAMGSMGYGGKGTKAESVTNPLAPEELEKRIADLRTVENWLKLNLSMLSSTIQGMEVQLATVKTLQSFVAMGQSGVAPSDTDASPLEVALGLKPAHQTKSAATATEATRPNPEATETQEQQADSTESPQQAAAQSWWNMLENQFTQIAAATANAAKVNNEHLQKAAATHQASASDTPKTTKRRAAKKTTRAARPAKKSSS